MLIGNYSNKVSLKGRTAVPAKFREQLGKKAVVTKGYERSLLLVSEDDWEKLIGSLKEQPFIFTPSRETDRFILGNAFMIDLDNQGRFVIPKSLRGHAQIKNTAVFVGVGNRIEIWEESRWQEHQKYLENNVEKIADSLAKSQMSG